MTLTAELSRALRSLDGAGGSPSPFGNIAGDVLIGELYRRKVLAEITLTSATGGATGAAIEVQLTDHQSNNIDRSRQVLLTLADTQYDPADPNATATIASAAGEPGSVIASAVGWALIETDETGKFEGTLTNAADETIYVNASTAITGVSDLSKGCEVIGSQSVAVSWAA